MQNKRHKGRRIMLQQLHLSTAQDLTILDHMSTLLPLSLPFMCMYVQEKTLHDNTHARIKYSVDS